MTPSGTPPPTPVERGQAMASWMVLVSEDELRALKLAAAAGSQSLTHPLSPPSTMMEPTVASSTPLQLKVKDDQRDVDTGAPLPPPPLLSPQVSLSSSQVQGSSTDQHEGALGQSPSSSISPSQVKGNSRVISLDDQLSGIPPKLRGVAKRIVHFLSNILEDELSWDRTTGMGFRFRGKAPHPSLTLEKLVKSMMYPHLGTKGIPLDLILVLSKFGIMKEHCPNQSVLRLVRSAARRAATAKLGGSDQKKTTVPHVINWLCYGARPKTTQSQKARK